MAHETTPKRVITEREAAAFTGVSQAALRLWRRESRGPAYVRFGRAIRYRVDDLDRFLDQHRVEPVNLERRG